MTALWHLARAYLGAVCLTLAALVTLVVAVTLVENAGILASQDAGGRTALGLAVFSGLDYAYQVLPIACFVGLLAAGCTLAQQGELLAVQAMGYGRRRQLLPFAAVTLLLVAAGSGCVETVLPRSHAERSRLQREQIKHVDPLTQFFSRRNPWFRQGAWLLYLPELQSRTPVRFGHPTAYAMQDGHCVRSIVASALVYDAGVWCLLDAEQEGLQVAGRQRVATLPLDLAVLPDDLVESTGNPRELSTFALRSLIHRRERAGFDTAAHRVALYSRLGQPLATIGLVCLALPWALDPERRRALASSLGPGIVVIAVYLALSQLLGLLALAHRLPALLGACGAPVLVCAFAPLSAALFRRRHN
jgi:lipopolysaccharide export system permease protein